MGQSTHQWKYVFDDPGALGEIKRRLEEAARTGGDLPTYSGLVEGVWFHLPSVHDGQPFEMDWSEYTPLYSDILGHFLGYLSYESYQQFGFMLSALAVSAQSMQPSPPFFQWARDLGALRRSDADGELEFWIAQVRRAQDHYRR